MDDESRRRYVRDGSQKTQSNTPQTDVSTRLARPTESVDPAVVQQSKSSRRQSPVTKFLVKNKLWLVIALVVLVAIVTSIAWWQWPRQDAPLTNPVAIEYQERLPDLEEKVKQEPDSAAARKNLAIALYATGDLGGAKQHYEKAASLDDKDSVLYNNLGNTYRDLGDIDKAVEAYKQSIELDPKSPNTYTNLANLQLYSLNQPDEAIRTYQSALKRMPENNDIQLLLGVAHEQKGDTEKARQSYQKVLDRDKDNVAAQASLDRLDE